MTGCCTVGKGEKCCSLTDFPFERCHIRRTLCIYFANIRRIHCSIITKPCEMKNYSTLTHFIQRMWLLSR